MTTGEDFNLNALIESYSWTLDDTQVAEGCKGDVKNGHVLYLLVRDNFNFLNVSKKLSDYFNNTLKKTLTLNNVRMRCRRLVESYKSLKKNIRTNWGTLKNLFEEQFLVVKRILIKKKENVPLPPVLELPACCHRDLHRDAFLKSISDLKTKLLTAKRTIKELKMKKKPSLKSINQKLKRKEATIVNCKKLRSILRAQVVLLQSENATLKSREESCLKERRALKKEVASLKKSLEKKASIITKANETIRQLTEQLVTLDSNSPGDEDDSKLRKVYGTHIRKCLFTCLESNVPVEKAEPLVKSVLKELTNTALTRFPAPNTIAQMAYEMGVISDLQVAENLYSSPVTVATIGWDATSIDGYHFNEINISLDGRTFTLEIGKLAGGSTSDYTRHLLDSIDSLASLYSTFAKLEQKVVLEKFHSMFHSTLSDKAPINNCVSDLSVFTPELALKTSSAPLHNMHSERALGMFDAHCSRAKNATTGFVDGKVKYKLNNTSVWLENKTFSEQKHIVSFARLHGAMKRKSLCVREKRIHEASVLRLKQMSQKRDKKKRKTLEKTIEGDQKLDSFQELTPETRLLCLSLLESTASFVGRTLYHTWQSDNSDTVFTGTVTKVVDKTIWIKYHAEKRVTKLSIFALVADIILGDAEFSVVS